MIITLEKPVLDPPGRELEPIREEAAEIEAALPEPKVVELARAEWALIGVGSVLATGVSLIGLASSYKALEKKAALAVSQGGWAWDYPWMLPVGLDLSILAFSIINLVLIRFDRPLAVVKWVPRVATAMTIYLNWAAGTSIPGQAGHAALVALWVVFAEVAAHAYRAHIGALHGRREMDRIRWDRWVLAPWSTAIIHRQMRLWEIPDYERALELYRDRAIYRQQLRQRLGRFLWRWKATSEDLLPLKMSKFNMTVAEALDLPDKEKAERALRISRAALRMQQDEREHALRIAQDDLRALKLQAETDTAKLDAQTQRLAAQARFSAAEAESEAAHDAVLRKAAANLRLFEAQATADVRRHELHAAIEAQRLEDEAAAERAAAERERELAQLKGQLDQVKLRAQLDAQLDEVQSVASLEAQRAREAVELGNARHRAAMKEADAKLAQAAEAESVATMSEAVARLDAAVARREEAVVEAEALALRVHSEEEEAEAKTRIAQLEAAEEEAHRAASVAVQEASVALVEAARSPKQRQELIVARMIRERGEDIVTVPYIQKMFPGMGYGTAQERRIEARRINAEDVAVLAGTG